jgi:adenosylhomocysteinase
MSTPAETEKIATTKSLSNPDGIRGAIEVTRSGITKLRAADNVPFPVININDGRLKDAIENRHGVGEAIWSAVGRLTGMHLAGRRCVVVGYGPVGKGLAAYGRSAGMAVDVVETDPIRRLFAHYDGYPTPSASRALTTAGIVVTATGRSGSITVDELKNARDGVVLLNAGHGGDEIDISAIARAADRVDNIAEQVVRYRIEGGPRVTVLADGHPLNIVLNNGSPEPVLLHFEVLGLSLEQLATTHVEPGEIAVTEELEAEAAMLALECLLPEGSL